MDPIDNPFVPGAGSQPPELAGRESILDDARTVLGRVKLGKQDRSQMLLGLRGVGKTVLLKRIEKLAGSVGYQTIYIEVTESQNFSGMLAQKLRSVLFKLSVLERTKTYCNQALGALRNFAAAIRFEVGEVGVGIQSNPGTADSGNLESDLPELLSCVAVAAKESNSCVAVFIDEVQYLTKNELSALIASIHRVSQNNLPFLVFGAGLPQLAKLAGEAKSYAERLFQYPKVGPLSEEAARSAITLPLERAKVRIKEDALAMIIKKTQGYPYFLQEWGSHTWNLADTSPITIRDVMQATNRALSQLDSGFFRVRIDRLTSREKDYMRAMSGLGPGPHRSGDIAEAMGTNVQNAGPIRTGLIKKGMIFSLQYGDTAFTVPMFDEFMCRAMPDWKA